jgi:poly-beta-1,6-N-acetyl-D-glucosamine N-deacetylase
MRNRVGLAKALALLAMLAPWPGWAADSAVIFSYHRFGDSRLPTANTTLEQLDAQIALLKGGGFTVLPLPVVVNALETGAPLPDKAVAISIDEAGRSLWEEAWPRFKAAGLPITLFTVTDELDRPGPDGMTWDQVRYMAASGLVTIATQGAARQHFPALLATEATADVTRAQTRLREELGKAPDLFAWPYGEASAEAAQAVREAGFKAAFGLHSGPAWRDADRWFLPRFALNETYGEADRFRLAARSLPLPAQDITPADPTLTANPPAFGFTLADEIPGMENLACYASHEGRTLLERLGPRVEVRLTKPLPKGRARLNCTAPSLDGRWRWFGWQFYVN